MCDNPNYFFCLSVKAVQWGEKNQFDIIVWLFSFQVGLRALKSKRQSGILARWVETGNPLESWRGRPRLGSWSRLRNYESLQTSKQDLRKLSLLCSSKEQLTLSSLHSACLILPCLLAEAILRVAAVFFPGSILKKLLHTGNSFKVGADFMPNQYYGVTVT